MRAQEEVYRQQMQNIRDFSAAESRSGKRSVLAAIIWLAVSLGWTSGSLGVVLLPLAAILVAHLTYVGIAWWRYRKAFHELEARADALLEEIEAELAKPKAKPRAAMAVHLQLGHKPVRPRTRRKYLFITPWYYKELLWDNIKHNFG